MAATTSHQDFLSFCSHILSVVRFLIMITAMVVVVAINACEVLVEHIRLASNARGLVEDQDKNECELGSVISYLVLY